MRRLRANLLLLAATVALCLLVLEIVLRLLGVDPAFAVPDRVLGYHPRPHARYRWTTEGHSEGRFNAEGWRDRDHARVKPSGTTRLLVVGDSFVEAFQVPFDSTFHQRLERTLNARAPRGRAFEVLAMGQSGSGTTQEYLAYEHWGARYDPDVVAVLFILNDPGDNWPVDAQDTDRPYLLPRGDTLALDTTFSTTASFKRRALVASWKTRSSLLSFAAQALRQGAVALRPNRGVAGLTGQAGWYYRWNFDRREPADSLPAFQVTERVLARFARDVQRDGRRFVVFAAGAAEQEDPVELARNRRDPWFDPDKTLRWITAAGKRSGFEVVPLTPDFRAARAAGSGPLWYGEPGHYGHWNAAGHAVAAEAMARWCAREVR